LCVIIGCKDGAVAVSCDEGASSAKLVGFFLLSDDFAAITGVEIAKEGGARLCVMIGCKDGAVFSYDGVLSASLVGLFLSDDFAPSDDVFLIPRSPAPGLNRLTTPFRGRGIVQLVIIF
jgi:hypothetical protein